MGKLCYSQLSANSGPRGGTPGREALHQWLAGTQTFKEKSFGGGCGALRTGMKPGRPAKEKSP